MPNEQGLHSHEIWGSGRGMIKVPTESTWFPEDHVHSLEGPAHNKNTSIFLQFTL